MRERLVLVVGPQAALSDYVCQEWRWALELDKPVIPILRCGDYPHVPGELSVLRCEDFRDDAQCPAALSKLIDNINRPAPPLGALRAVSSLRQCEPMRRVMSCTRLSLGLWGLPFNRYVGDAWQRHVVHR